MTRNADADQSRAHRLRPVIEFMERNADASLRRPYQPLISDRKDPYRDC
jgi:hypothetical protein